jgi:hypothetical protein
MQIKDGLLEKSRPFFYINDYPVLPATLKKRTYILAGLEYL